MTKPRNKKWEGIQNKKRTEPSDQERVFKLKKDIDSLKEYHMLTGQTIEASGIRLLPDGMVTVEGYSVPVEHDGLIHGVGEKSWESPRTQKKMEDYIRLGYFPIIVNSEWLRHHKIDQKTYVQCALFSLSQWLRAKRRLGK